MSAILGSPVAVVPFVRVVLSEGAMDGALKVENLFDVRFEATCM